MKSIINEYCAYTPYASEIGDAAYDYGSEVAKKAFEDGKNSYEVMCIVVDNIMSAFAVQRATYGMKVRKGKEQNGQL
ncbi:MAG: hypothetical protein EOL93_09560 [Epsilonproteobacteria bacterium]|nr:hypothetical protein [Campylobacterota bacterium]